MQITVNLPNQKWTLLVLVHLPWRRENLTSAYLQTDLSHWRKSRWINKFKQILVFEFDLHGGGAGLSYLIIDDGRIPFSEFAPLNISFNKRM